MAFCPPQAALRPQRRPIGALQLQALVLRRVLGYPAPAAGEDSADAVDRGGANARVDLQRKLDEGELPVETGIRFHEARERFVDCSARRPRLNKHGHRYKRRALDDIEECLRVHAEPRLGSKRLSQIRRGDVQAIVDELAPTMSGSRVRSVVNAIRSLYRWARTATSPTMIRPPWSGCRRWTRRRSSASPRRPSSRGCSPRCPRRMRCPTHSPATGWLDARRSFACAGTTSISMSARSSGASRGGAQVRGLASGRPDRAAAPGAAQARIP